MCDHKRNRGWHTVRAFLASWLLLQAGTPPENLAAAPPPKLKVRGYLTARVDDTTVAILDDQIHCTSAKIVAHDSSGDRPITGGELATGMLVEAEGSWTGHHQFTAERVTVDAGLLEKQIHYAAYLQEEPKDAERIKNGAPAELKVDGEWLLVDPKTKRSWAAPAPAVVNANDTSGGKTPDAAADSASPGNLAGYRVEYHGTRLADGKISAEKVALGAPAPADAYKMPHGLEVVRAKDPQTGIDILEFRRGKKVDGRMKLFPDKTVQTYVCDLGVFMAELGMISVINGHQRELENQADRLGLQNVIEHGYDPRPAPGFMRIIIERYGIRSTSKLWSNHDSALLRGSFLTVQLMKQYPDHHFDGARVNTAAFDSMHDALGPVRIE